jgi:hypothetical protein
VISGIWAWGFLFHQKQHADPGCPFWMTRLSQSKQTQWIVSPWSSRYGIHMLPEVKECLTTMLFVHKALCYLTFSNGSHTPSHSQYPTFMTLCYPNVMSGIPKTLWALIPLFSRPHSS